MADHDYIHVLSNSVHYRRRAVGGDWTDPALRVGSGPFDFVSIELDGNTLHAAWIDNQDEYRVHYATGNASQGTFTAGHAAVDMIGCASPELYIDSADRVHAVWTEVGLDCEPDCFLAGDHGPIWYDVIE